VKAASELDYTRYIAHEQACSLKIGSRIAAALNEEIAKTEALLKRKLRDLMDSKPGMILNTIGARG
jgi:hypothetical protein